MNIETYQNRCLFAMGQRIWGNLGLRNMTGYANAQNLLSIGRDRLYLLKILQKTIDAAVAICFTAELHEAHWQEDVTITVKQSDYILNYLVSKGG